MSLTHSDRLQLIAYFRRVWVSQNPCLFGPNWKCGQEASLRLIHFLISLRVLGESPADLDEESKNFVRNHLMRIRPTLSYAKGQKNNHWISEAAGLVIGGVWLGAEGEEFVVKGSSELRLAFETLFNVDGTFAQSSINYLKHALTLIAIVRLELAKENRDFAFADRPKIVRSLELFRLFSRGSPTTHNFGANDGTEPLGLSGESFLDLRVYQAFFDLSFRGEIYSGDHENMIAICKTYSSLGKELESGIFGDTPKLPSLENRFIIYPKGGLAFYIRKKYQVLIRLPAFAFKPSQDDVGHFDMILNGIDLASDAGTYSYFCDPRIFNYFRCGLAQYSV